MRFLSMATFIVAALSGCMQLSGDFVRHEPETLDDLAGRYTVLLGGVRFESGVPTWRVDRGEAEIAPGADETHALITLTLPFSSSAGATEPHRETYRISRLGYSAPDYDFFVVARDGASGYAGVVARSRTDGRLYHGVFFDPECGQDCEPQSESEYRATATRIARAFLASCRILEDDGENTLDCDDFEMNLHGQYWVVLTPR